MNSFICEHTAEYILVPQLRRILSEQYQKAIPVKFSSSREGSSLSRKSFNNKSIQLLAVYARRPKIVQPNEGIIQVKFNQLLFDRAKFLNKHGIPVIVGVPLIDSLEELQPSSASCWFKINSKGAEQIIKIHLSNVLFDAENIEIVGNKDILNIMENEAKNLTWSEAVNILSEYKKQNRQENNFSFWGDRYKPTFFLCFK